MSILKLKSAKELVIFKSGSELLEIKRINPTLPLKFGCTRGQCGVCAVEVVSGSENISKKCPQEEGTLAKKRLGPNWRLACQCALNGDVELA